MNGEIFIPMNDRTEIWIKPKLDTLNNKQEYEFRIRVAPEYKVSQFLFEKGLAVQNDSILKIVPNSNKYGEFDTAALRVIVTSIKGSRTYLFQKKFIIRVPEKMYPVISNPKINVVKVNDKVLLERNKPYPKTIFTEKTFVTCYDNDRFENKMDVKNVTIALYEKEGKQYVSNADTITSDALKELKKIKDPTPVYIKVDGLIGKIRKSVWSRIVVYVD
jgi:hypothetical protein